MANEPGPPEPHEPREPETTDGAAPGLAVVPLAVGIVLALALTAYPLFLSRADGKADHLAATLLLGAMSAGFVRGVGFVPRHRLLRLLFSTSACLLMLALGVALLARRGLGD